MEEKKIDLNINRFKPRMRTLSSIQSLKIAPSETVVMVKLDGEFTYLKYMKEGSFTVNRWGHLRLEFPALNEFVEAMKQSNINEAELLCELYIENGKLPDFLHHIKSGNPLLLKKVRIAIFDLISINGVGVHQNYAWKLDEVEGWIKNCRLCTIPPYIKPQSKDEVETFWKTHVPPYEGLVARSNDTIYKIKPIHELDAVIMGINKRELFFDKKVTSVKLALMEYDRFIEIGDCASGISPDLRLALWKLMDFKVGEDDYTVYIQPLVIVQIEYTDLFYKARNKVFEYTPQKGYIHLTFTKLARLRHPRLTRFRPDKQVTEQDLSIKQIPPPNNEE